MSRPSPTRQKSMSFAEDSPAKTSPPLAEAPGSAKKHGVDSRSTTYSGSLTRSSLGSSQSRTSPRGPSAGFLAWCRSLSIEVIDPGPFLSAPSTSERPICDAASSLWPTATVQHRAGSAAYGTDAVKGLWPRRPAQGTGSPVASNKHGDNSRPLNKVVALYPTPSAVSYGNNRGGAAGRVGPVRESLESMARAWPTPQSRDERGPTGVNGRDVRSSLSDAAMPGATSGRLNPAWVATLIGFPSTWLDISSLPAEVRSNTRGKPRAPSQAT